MTVNPARPPITPEGLVLMKDVLADFRAGRRKHDQFVWICGTACCLAGGAVLAAGGRAFDDRSGRRNSTCITSDGDVLTIPDYATELFGFDEAHAFGIYYVTNTLEDLENMAAVLAEGKPAFRRCDECHLVTPTTHLRQQITAHRGPLAGLEICGAQHPSEGCWPAYRSMFEAAYAQT